MLVCLKPTPERVPSRKHATTFAHDHTVDGRTSAPPFKNPGMVRFPCRCQEPLWFPLVSIVRTDPSSTVGVNSWYLWGDQEGKPELDVEVLEEPENWEGGVWGHRVVLFCGAEHKSAEFFVWWCRTQVGGFFFFFCGVSLKFRHF